MTSPDWGAIFARSVLPTLLDTTFLMIAIQASRGERSSVAGIQLPALMKSDTAWRSGHAAARRALTPMTGAGIAIFSILLSDSSGRVRISAWRLARLDNRVTCHGFGSGCPGGEN